jgi:uncharacterized protein involved in exopolysaccharide biosynthesis
MNNQLISQEPARTQGKRELLTVLFRHKTRILTVFTAIVILVVAYTFMSAEVFEARSTLMVKIGREYLTRPEVGDKQPVMALNQEAVINSEIQILTNRDLLRKVIETITPEILYPEISSAGSSRSTPLELSIERFEKSLTVEGVKKSSVIEVTFRHKTPQLAARAVNLLVEYYREKHLQVFSDPQSSFLESQLGSYAQKLSETESSLESFKQSNRVYSLAEQRTLLLQQRSALDTNLKGTENSISELQKKTVELKQQLLTIGENDGSYTQTERDKIIVEGKAKLLTLQLQEQDLRKKYTEDNRLVVNARKDIALVKAFLREQEDELGKKVRNANPVYQDIKRDLFRAETEFSGLRSKAAVISSQLRSVDGEIRALDLSEKKLENLKREKALNEKNYQTYAERTEEARISDEMNRLKLANISVIQTASIPSEPVMPRKKLNLIIGLLFGAAVGIGIAFLAEYLSQDFSTPEKVESLLGLPVLTSIPYKEG